MQFKKKLIEATLIQRYKRFFADIEYTHPDTRQKEQITIHVPNTGSLLSVLAKPAQKQKCWFSEVDDPTRKLKGTLEAVQTLEGTWVGVNTSYPNKIVKEVALASVETQKPFFKHWNEYLHYKAEIKINKESRLDGVFYFKDEDLENKKAKKHFIEIKNTTLMKIVDGKKHAQFPDGVTERGQKHLYELMNLMDEGHKAELIFTVQRTDCDLFSVAENIDPQYADLFRKAVKKGLIVTPVVVDLNQTQISLTKKVLEIARS